MTDPESYEPGENDIAVVGLACRFPGAADRNAYWDNLQNGVASVTELSDEALLAAGVPRAAFESPDYVRKAAILPDIDRFDAAFFGITPGEAEHMDPQHRLFLETAWHALEHAGVDPDRAEGPIGLFAGAAMNTYGRLQADGGMLDLTRFYAHALGNDKDFLPTRTAYKLNLKGPALCVQTACSTSLTAVHLACQSLLAGESDLALAGGVALMVPQTVGYHYQPGMILAKDGVCRPFDAAASGIIGGNGVGVVALMRVQDARDQGKPMYAVVKGIAVNNDGAAKVGFTAPAVEGQARVIDEALAMADVDPDSIGLIEAHGTATPLGDPIEVAALTKVFRAQTDRVGYCALGSVKSNFGHLNTAAGIAGFIKAVLALHHRTLPPSLHFETPNPKLNLATSPFFVNTRKQAWHTAAGKPRRAGVSSFGIGGTNVHAVLEEASKPRPSTAAGGPYLLPLSAHDPAALTALAATTAAALDHPACDLSAAAQTLSLGRKPMAHRTFAVAASGPDAALRLRAAVPTHTDAHQGEIAFLLPGQGAQMPGMARDLNEFPVFRETLARTLAAARPHLDTDLAPLLFCARDDAEAVASLRQTRLAQPALFAIGVAMAAQWRAWGVEPTLLLGHSLGEYTAACLAEVFSLEDGMGLVCERARLMQNMPPGAMLAVPLAEIDVAAHLGAGIELAAVNGPKSAVLTGEPAALTTLQQQLQARGLNAVKLHTSHAFHSHHTEALRAPFAAALSKVTLKPPRLPMMCNLTGKRLSDSEAVSPDYWLTQMRKPVRFNDCLRTLLSTPRCLLLEIGPGATLAGLAQNHPRFGTGHTALATMPHAKSQTDGTTFVLESLGKTWCAGVDLNWEALHGDQPRRTLALPAYPFQRKRFWWPQGSPAPSTETTTQTTPSYDLFAPTWTKLIEPPQANAKPGLWWLVTNGRRRAPRFLEDAEADGHRIVLFSQGDGFQKIATDRFAVNLAAAGAQDALLATMAQIGTPEQIVFCSDLDLGAEQDPTDPNHGPMDGALKVYENMAELLRSVTNLPKTEHGHPTQITLLTRGLENVTGREPLFPHQAPLIGLLRVAVQEVPDLKVRFLDLDPEDDRGELLYELLKSQSPARHLAQRGQTFWARTIQPAPPRPQTPFRAEPGLYLITGGTGGVGAALAEVLAGPGVTLLLTGRTALPGLDGTTQADADSDDPTARALAAVKRLRDAGAEVVTAQADVTDRAAMTQLIEAWERRGRRVRGVIHAAGGARVQTIAAGNSGNWAREPKIAGTLVLGELFARRPLDWMVLCSSMAAELGGIGLADYAAANAFLDAFAEWRDSRFAGRTMSINWDGWHNTGQSRTAPGTPVGMPPQRGQALFAGLLQKPLTRVWVTTTDIEQRRNRAAAGLTRDPDETPAPSAKRGSHPRPPLANPYVAARNPLETLLADTWAAQLGLEQVGIHDNFFDLGASSFLAVQVHAALRGPLQKLPTPPKTLRVSDFFEYPTIAQLAANITPAETPAPTAANKRDRGARQRQAMARDNARRTRKS
ncbi:type I polyketide synthase [Acanthopleuribacter pedis]|uniref:SDR family NAD(P)-dependent oxidoreductase n=1 Tax=Acanthopleuribacter pedis TaxID=442870 RepID=A0A8J7Q5S3_9BACT|nr:type I polyketide synthase [Acanthopleuribacter pedis]MBO1317350.1 SDR family NAD(P)-dependent oxidoreductase [Acanthopleuribacter pedis]MBO1318657.1 SDR family NAD(P)-dependent oxidoreductase [Acanthopleuribacter pedis]